MIDKKKDFLNRRRQMFVFGLLGLLCLAAWTLSAFWTHIKALNEDYQIMAFAGAAFGELVLVDLLWSYCFDKSLKVRREAIIYEFILIVVLAGHAGILRGMHSIEQRQTSSETRLKDTLTEMSNKQIEAIKGAEDSELNPRTRRAADAAAAEAKHKIATNAQSEVAGAIKSHDSNVISQTLAPEWYINGAMYALIFLIAALCAARVKWLHAHVAPEDLDENFDGIPDIDQQPQRQQISIPRDSLSDEDRDQFDRIVAPGTGVNGSTLSEQDREKIADIINRSQERSQRPSTQAPWARSGGNRLPVAQWRNGQLLNPEDFSEEEQESLHRMKSRIDKIEEERGNNGQNGNQRSH